MKAKRIVRGAHVSEAKYQVARKLRRTATREERALWGELRAGKLGGFHFRRQQVIRGFIVDFFCAEAELVVEVDGGSHVSRKEYDEERDQVLSDLGLRVIRFRNLEIQTGLGKVLNRILMACLEGGGG